MTTASTHAGDSHALKLLPNRYTRALRSTVATASVTIAETGGHDAETLGHDKP